MSMFLRFLKRGENKQMLISIVKHGNCHEAVWHSLRQCKPASAHSAHSSHTPVLYKQSFMHSCVAILDNTHTVTVKCDETLDQLKYLCLKQSHSFPLWASSGLRN